METETGGAGPSNQTVARWVSIRDAVYAVAAVGQDGRGATVLRPWDSAGAGSASQQITCASLPPYPRSRQRSSRHASQTHFGSGKRSMDFLDTERWGRLRVGGPNGWAGDCPSCRPTPIPSNACSPVMQIISPFHHSRERRGFPRKPVPVLNISLDAAVALAEGMPSWMGV